MVTTDLTNKKENKISRNDFFKSLEIVDVGADAHFSGETVHDRLDFR